MSIRLIDYKVSLNFSCFVFGWLWAVSFVKRYTYRNIHMSMVLTVVSGMTSAQIVKNRTAQRLYLIRSLLFFLFGVEWKYLDDPIKNASECSLIHKCEPTAATGQEMNSCIQKGRHWHLRYARMIRIQMIIHIMLHCIKKRWNRKLTVRSRLHLVILGDIHATSLHPFHHMLCQCTRCSSLITQFEFLNASPATHDFSF